MQPLNASTNLLRAPNLTVTQHQLGEDTNLQFLQAPTCRQRHKVSPSTSLPPLFARISNRIKMQQYRYVSAYQTTLLCSTSALCSSVLFNCSAHSLVPLLCCTAHSVSVYSTDPLILYTPLLSSKQLTITTVSAQYIYHLLSSFLSLFYRNNILKPLQNRFSFSILKPLQKRFRFNILMNPLYIEWYIFEPSLLSFFLFLTLPIPSPFESSLQAVTKRFTIQVHHNC